MADLNKKTLEHLAELARIDLGEAPTLSRGSDMEVGKEKLLKNLREILDYFEELNQVDTSGVEPMTGGTSLKNILRNDENATDDTGKGADQFPEKSDNYLKVPPVF